MKNKNSWWALIVLCLGTLMIVLDTTIVNVALPSIKADLNFSETSLAWVVNAYMLTFGGLLLLGGRLGDIFGQRRMFLIGISMFTLASLACGVAQTQVFLLVARGLQGIAGAIVSAVSLSMIMTLFTGAQRPKAMGIFGFVAAGGGAIGVFLGGLLTGALNWHWIFLVNLPIGILVFVLSLMILPHSPKENSPGHLDIAGALTITSSMMIAVYAIVNGNIVGWSSMQTLGLLVISLFLLIVFILIESKISKPLIPLKLFRMRNICVSNIVGVFWAAAMFAWFFISALYMQLVLKYSPLKVGLAFLPANIIMAIFSVWLSAKLVMRFGIRKPLFIGLFLAAIGLGLLARAPIDGQFIFHILPSMLLLGIGAGMAFNPMLLAAMNDVNQNESGLASGLVNTSFMMGGALGLAVLASIASSYTKNSLSTGANELVAITGGYHAAFIAGAILAFAASSIAAIFLKVDGNHA